MPDSRPQGADHARHALRGRRVPIRVQRAAFGILDLGLILTIPLRFSAVCRPAHVACPVFLRGPIFRLLIGACNPMLWPFHLFRPPVAAGTLCPACYRPPQGRSTPRSRSASASPGSPTSYSASAALTPRSPTSTSSTPPSSLPGALGYPGANLRLGVVGVRVKLVVCECVCVCLKGEGSCMFRYRGVVVCAVVGSLFM